MSLLYIVSIIILVIVAVVEGYIFFIVLQASKKNKEFEGSFSKREDDAKYQMYEIEILNRLSSRIGYSLSAQNIIEIVKDSLPDITDYNTVSVMMFSDEKIIFKSDIKKAVSYDFIEEVKGIMLNYASDIFKKDFKDFPVEENLKGRELDDESKEHVGSFLNIPLTISGQVVGIINVADARANFYKDKEKNTLTKITEKAGQAVTQLQNVIELETNKLNAMVSSMTDGVIMINMESKIIVVNPAARKAMGFGDKKDLLISDFATVLGGKIDITDKIQESIMMEKVFMSEEISLPTGFFKIVVSPVKSKWENLGCVVVFRDITHEKEVQQIKEDFTSMIVHELRSPLDSIKKMIEMMRAKKAKKQSSDQYLQMIYASSSDMLELVNNLLDIAKIEAGKFQLIKQPSDIKEIISSRVMFFDIASKDAKVALQSQFAKDIPDKVDFDQHTISQVLNNFISNAMKFNREKGYIKIQALLHKNGVSVVKEAKDAGIEWFIEKDMQEMPDSLVVAVTNSGIGIAKDQIDKLFNKFFQVKSVFAQKGGTGLGLAISKSIVESHGGVVGAESVQGEGATFYFTLPINK